MRIAKLGRVVLGIVCFWVSFIGDPSHAVAEDTRTFGRSIRFDEVDGQVIEPKCCLEFYDGIVEILRKSNSDNHRRSQAMTMTGPLIGMGTYAASGGGDGSGLYRHWLFGSVGMFVTSLVINKIFFDEDLDDVDPKEYENVVALLHDAWAVETEEDVLANANRKKINPEDIPEGMVAVAKTPLRVVLVPNGEANLDGYQAVKIERPISVTLKNSSHKPGKILDQAKSRIERDFHVSSISREAFIHTLRSSDHLLEVCKRIRTWEAWTSDEILAWLSYEVPERQDFIVKGLAVSKRQLSPSSAP